MRASIARESKRCNTDGRSAWTAGEIVENKLLVHYFVQIRPLHHSQPIIFSAHPHTLTVEVWFAELHCRPYFQNIIM